MKPLMKPGIKKVASGKTMRVATVFTGAAACAAAFAPAAHAATGFTRTAIKETNSCGTVPRWVHLKNNILHVSQCYGFDGITSAGGFAAASICGGNNSGWVVSFYGDATHFKPGNTFVHLPWPNNALLGSVEISNSQPAGHHAC